MPSTQLTPEILVPRIGDQLVEKGLITQDDLNRALQYQETLRARGEDRLIGQIMIDLGMIDSATREAVIYESILQLRGALQEANQQLERRVQERTAELQRAMEKLSEVNQLKANIVSNISHELRTPLTHLKGYVELLTTGELGPINEQQHTALSVIERSGERLNRLIDDLIQFSVSERDQLQLRLAPVNVEQLCDSATRAVEKKALSRNITILQECAAQLPEIECDQEKIGWVIQQFLDNSIKFTTPGGTVTLRAEQQDGLVVISVLDTGIGIPTARIDEIFESFTQLDGSTTRRAGGTGLGLALARRIVEAHGSTIKVSSEVGKGSCFSITMKVFVHKG